jgi:hypothetical protein
MAELKTFRRSKVLRRCEGWQCKNWILPCDVYLRTSIPPFRGDMGNEHWWTMIVCKLCMSTEDRKTAEERNV